MHPYTLKDDFLMFTDNPISEHQVYLNKQVDGIFSEFPHMTHVVFSKFSQSNSFPFGYLEHNFEYVKEFLEE